MLTYVSEYHIFLYTLLMEIREKTYMHHLKTNSKMKLKKVREGNKLKRIYKTCDI